MPDSIFLGCFLFGALFTALSAVLGALGGHDLGAGHGHHGGALGAPRAPHARLPARAGHSGPAHQASPSAHSSQASQPVALWHPSLFLNLSSMVAFVCWFGAAGYVLHHHAGWGLAPALAAAIAAGLTGGWLVGAFFAKVRAGDSELHPEDFRLEGMLARVTVSIPEGGVGEIVFSQAGAVRSEAARAIGGAIPSEAQVVVTGYERGIAQVQAYDDFFGGH